jgi:ribosome recycling factor
MLEQLITQVKGKMQKAVEVTVQDVGTIRSGRATPSLVENISVSCYAGTTRMRVLEMATISTQDSKTIVITPYDPSQLQELAKGLLEANIGLTPVVDGEIIRISIPPLSEERRREYLKLAKTKIEAGKVMIRMVRADAMKEVKVAEQEKLITQDEEHTAEKLIQEATDIRVRDLDELEKRKEQELLAI